MPCVEGYWCAGGIHGWNLIAATCDCVAVARLLRSERHLLG